MHKLQILAVAVSEREKTAPSNRQINNKRKGGGELKVRPVFKLNKQESKRNNNKQEINKQAHL